MAAACAWTSSGLLDYDGMPKACKTIRKKKNDKVKRSIADLYGFFTTSCGMIRMMLGNSESTITVFIRQISHVPNKNLMLVDNWCPCCAAHWKKSCWSTSPCFSISADWWIYPRSSLGNPSELAHRFPWGCVFLKSESTTIFLVIVHIRHYPPLYIPPSLSKHESQWVISMISFWIVRAKDTLWNAIGDFQHNGEEVKVSVKPVMDLHLLPNCIEFGRLSGIMIKTGGFLKWWIPQGPWLFQYQNGLIFGWSGDPFILGNLQIMINVFTDWCFSDAFRPANQKQDAISIYGRLHHHTRQKCLRPTKQNSRWFIEWRNFKGCPIVLSQSHDRNDQVGGFHQLHPWILGCLIFRQAHRGSRQERLCGIWCARTKLPPLFPANLALENLCFFLCELRRYKVCISNHFSVVVSLWGPYSLD